jgi:aryl-alcohol dehydrogenase-like predicted oxidoreductase
MEYRDLGNTGTRTSEIGFGAWAIGSHWGPQKESDSIEALHEALDRGVNFIDTAYGYGNGKSERIIASVLKDRREEVTVATKIPPMEGPWPPTPYCDARERLSESYLRKMLDACRKNLDTDCVDIVQIHTWTRSWNVDPRPLEVLAKLREEGVLRLIGVSTPEHDQNALNDLMRQGLIDTIQVIYNIFEQEPAAELLPLAARHGVGVIVRVVFDEGVLTGKYTAEHRFPVGDFRNRYFAGDRLARAVQRVEHLRKELEGTGYTLPQAAVKFALAHPAVSNVITGIRNKEQAILNTSYSDGMVMDESLQGKLRRHAWLRGFWYDGK